MPVWFLVALQWFGSCSPFNQMMMVFRNSLISSPACMCRGSALDSSHECVSCCWIQRGQMMKGLRGGRVVAMVISAIAFVQLCFTLTKSWLLSLFFFHKYRIGFLPGFFKNLCALYKSEDTLLYATPGSVWKRVVCRDICAVAVPRAGQRLVFENDEWIQCWWLHHQSVNMWVHVEACHIFTHYFFLCNEWMGAIQFNSLLWVNVWIVKVSSKCGESKWSP